MNGSYSIRVSARNDFTIGLPQDLVGEPLNVQSTYINILYYVMELYTVGNVQPNTVLSTTARTSENINVIIHLPINFIPLFSICFTYLILTSATNILFIYVIFSHHLHIIIIISIFIIIIIIFNIYSLRNQFKFNCAE